MLTCVLDQTRCIQTLKAIEMRGQILSCSRNIFFNTNQDYLSVILYCENIILLDTYFNIFGKLKFLQVL